MIDFLLSVTVIAFSLFFRHDGTDSPADVGDVRVVLNSFHSKIIKVRVSIIQMYIKRFMALSIIEFTVKCSSAVFHDVHLVHRSQIEDVEMILHSL